MSTEPKLANKPKPVCHECGRPAVAYDKHKRLVCAIHTLHPYSKFNLNQGKKVGRNDPCSCGSGRKFKTCCGRPIPMTVPVEPSKQETEHVQNQV